MTHFRPLGSGGDVGAIASGAFVTAKILFKNASAVSGRSISGKK
jgi:hypothetical protein